MLQKKSAEHREWSKSEEGKKLKKSKAVARVRARESKKLNAMPWWVDRDKLQEVYVLCRLLSNATGVVHHVDHIVPLQNARVCGLHVPWNLQIITAEENLKKSNKFQD
jgi:5-methylcytosine-specific restriction endonuclease McrA